jgi:hypothetical protein
VNVPADDHLALANIAPNPSKNGFTVSFSLPNAAPARLSLVDVTGREVESHDVGGMGSGLHQVDLGRNASLRAGVYWVRLSQAGQMFSRRAVIVK